MRANGIALSRFPFYICQRNTDWWTDARLSTFDAGLWRLKDTGLWILNLANSGRLMTKKKATRSVSETDRKRLEDLQVELDQC